MRLFCWSCPTCDLLCCRNPCSGVLPSCHWKILYPSPLQSILHYYFYRLSIHVIGWLNTSRLSAIVHHVTFWYIKLHLPVVCPLTNSVQIILQWYSISLVSNWSKQLVSSANFSVPLVVPTLRSLINIKNKTGPSTEPWGTPLMTCCQLELEPSSLIFCHLSFNHASIQLQTTPSMPCARSFNRRRWWGTLSNAFESLNRWCFVDILLCINTGCYRF